MALVRLCEALPDHDKWMKWYSAVVLHSEYYLKPAAAVDEPYSVLPAAVYRDSEARLIPESKNWTPLRAADRDAYRRGSAARDCHWAANTIFADFRSGSIFVAIPAFCFRKPRHSPPPDICEAICRLKIWLRNRRSGWSAAILSLPA